MNPEEINNIYLETMRQMDIDFDKEQTLIRKLKISGSLNVDSIQESLNFQRESFFSKYSWTRVPSFFHIDSMRKDYLNKSAERCKIIYDEIYNS